MTFIKFLQFINPNGKLSVVDFNTQKHKHKNLANVKWITLCAIQKVSRVVAVTDVLINVI